MNKDLTVGSPTKTLWLFCLPLFGSILFQQLYNLADSFVAGRFIGENAFAAVGNGYEVTMVFLAFAFGCNIGCSVTVSEFFGGKRYRDVKTAITTAFLVTAAVCATLMLLGLLLCGPLLRLINTPAEIYADSRLYLNIYILGLPFVFFYNVTTGVFTALGDSRTPFYFLAASSLSNIGMDILFVAGFGMQVEGVAWATFLCQGVSCLLALFFLFRRLRTLPRDEGERAPLFDRRIFRKFLRIALPSTLQQSFISVGNVAIQRVINGFGPATIAGYSAAIKLNTLVIASFATIGNGISNYTAQNVGAGRSDRVRAGFRAGFSLVFTIALPFFLLYFLLGDLLMVAFMENPSAEALASGFTFLRIVSPFYLLIATKLVADAIMRGAGFMKRFMIATFTDLALRVILAFALAETALGSTGIWCAWPIGWAVAALMSLLLYFSLLRKRKI